MSESPLLADYRPRAALIRGTHGVLTQARWLAAVTALAGRLPASGPALNLCESRQHFLTALGAALVRGHTCVLPPSAAPDLLASLINHSAGAYALTEAAPENGWQQRLIRVPTTAPPADRKAVLPLIADDCAAVTVYTSGSCGQPQPHVKRWAALLAVARRTVVRFPIFQHGAQVVATVPAQHMYGLETTAMMALAGRCTLYAERPFFPLDIARALRALPPPRVLVTTPVHLRACLRSELRLPPLALILSATAPLPADMAAQAESRFRAPLYEIYGCTEAGTIATRRTVNGDTWQLLQGLRLEHTRALSLLHTPYLPQPVLLQDRVERVDDERFRLLGRSGDLLKVAGKRASLEELTRHLLAIPGVEDAVVFQPDGDRLVGRPAALVVAPTLSAEQILAALAHQVDAAFLPRPLKHVLSLPRNAVGKLPRAQLRRLLTERA